tara:strand:- start:514 stop:801 length:288 start_codon:yes stop_codon:yes gene_type:complete
MSNNTLKKIDISKEISEKIGFSLMLSKKILDDLIEVLSQNLKKNNLSLKNIGSFKIIYKSERIGRNPKTGENFKIKPRKSISFKVSKKLLKNVNL